MVLPVDFSYWQFALVLFLNGVAFGMFASPNTAAVMNSVPARDRGVASGMRSTCNMLGMPLSQAIFFSLMIVGLSANLQPAMLTGLTAHHVPAALAGQLAHMPPTSYLFAAFLGFNPLAKLLGPTVLGALPAADAHALVSKTFFPSLIGTPFKDGMVDVLIFATVMCLVAALASWLRGGKFVHAEALATHSHAGDARRRQRERAATEPATESEMG